MSRRKQKRNYTSDQYENNIYFNTLGTNFNRGASNKIDFSQASEKIDSFFNEITFGLNTTENAIKTSIAPITKAAFSGVPSKKKTHTYVQTHANSFNKVNDTYLSAETITIEDNKNIDTVEDVTENNVMDTEIINQANATITSDADDDLIIDNVIEDVNLHEDTITNTDLNANDDVNTFVNANMDADVNAIVNTEVDTDVNEVVNINTYANENTDYDTYVDSDTNTNVYTNMSTTSTEEDIYVEDNTDTLIEDDIPEPEVETKSNIDESFIDKSKIYARFEEKNDFFEKNNDTLLISEKENKVFLPYSMDDVQQYLTAFSDKYSNARDVIENEFVVPLNYFTAYSFAARFREAYALYRDREGKSAVESFIFAFKTMKIGNLQAAIIAACRNERVFNDYLTHLRRDDLENFHHFKIEYQITPLVK